MKNKKQSGFTLIELLVVVLIIGILSAIALPQYTLAVEKSRAVEAITTITNVQRAIDIYLLENGYPEEDISFLGDNTNGHALLSIDVESALDCTQNGGTACGDNRSFVYYATCTKTGCGIDAFRKKNGEDNDDDQYDLYMSKSSGTDMWTKGCWTQAEEDFPYSKNLCKGLASQGWGYNENI